MGEEVDQPDSTDSHLICDDEEFMDDCSEVEEDLGEEWKLDDEEEFSSDDEEVENRCRNEVM